MHPSTKRPRLDTVDILRGFALFGIMLAHFIHWYTAGPLPQAVFNKFGDAGTGTAEIINNLLVTGKFFSFFSFLFGLSFYLQLRSLEDQPQTFVRRFAWRLALLMLIGLIHHAFWLGDILSIYVPLGFVLLLLRRLSDRWVLALGLLLVANVPGRMMGLVSLLSGSMPAGFAGFESMGQAYEAVVARGSLADILRFNLMHFGTKFEFQVVSGRLFITLGFFLLGMYTGRKGWFDLGLHCRPVFQKVWKRTLALSAVCLLLALGLAGASKLWNLGFFQNPWINFGFMGLYDLFNAALTLSIITGLTLATFRKSGKQWMRHLAPVGKMALTSYLAQTAFGLLLFFGIGFGLYGLTSPGLNYLLAIAFFVLQVGISHWWLRYFHYGPVEWLWRSGTLMHRQPLKRRPKSLSPDESLPPDYVPEWPAGNLKV
ncbi:MAG TPA: DUF418 domain-containing protein [Chitinophagaceae bacterium]|jgi:uncharacterized protein|nr:DUF418 domain-containing protein [Chitinophagaceae bacterium]